MWNAKKSKESPESPELPEHPKPIDNEIEVFRKEPKVGLPYMMSNWTRTIDKYPNQRYFTTNIPVFQGYYIKHYQRGSGDGADHYYVFEKQGKEIELELDYAGKMSFVEYDSHLQAITTFLCNETQETRIAWRIWMYIFSFFPNHMHLIHRDDM